MLCSVVRTKCIALWLGAAGIGIFGLYNTALEVINQLVQLNLRQSGVREIAGAPVSRVAYMTAVIRHLGVLLGIIGALITLILSPLLSQFTFGDSSHTVYFAVLSVVVFLCAIISGEQAVLQASGKFKRLALASMWGGVGGTAVSILLVRLFGFDAIVPSIISFGIITASVYYVRRDKGVPQSITMSQLMKSSKPVVRLGVYMTAAMFVTQLSHYMFLSWMRKQVGDDGVGVYQSGYTIINQYVGLVFTAIAVEFYPRVSSVSGSRWRVSVFVRHEMSMIMWGMSGAAILFVNLAPVIIHLLYSEEFAGATEYVTVASVGTVFKAISFVLAYIMLARADGRIFLFTESVSAVLYFIFNVIGYKAGGMAGLGYAYVVWYAAYVVSVASVYRIRYRMRPIGRPMVLASAVLIMVAAQATLCMEGFYRAATVVSSIVVPLSGIMFYFLFLKRRTLKE